MARQTVTCSSCSGTGDGTPFTCPQCSGSCVYNGKPCDACTNGKYTPNCNSCGGEGSVVVVTKD